MVTEQNQWTEWILFMVKAVEQTAVSTLQLIKSIIELKTETLERFAKLPQKVPAYEINELLFSHPYLKIKTLEENKIGFRNTVSKYLQMMEKEGIVKGTKIGREMYYLNEPLMRILTNKPDMH